MAFTVPGARQSVRPKAPTCIGPFAQTFTSELTIDMKNGIARERETVQVIWSMVFGQVERRMERRCNRKSEWGSSLVRRYRHISALIDKTILGHRTARLKYRTVCRQKRRGDICAGNVGTVRVRHHSIHILTSPRNSVDIKHAYEENMRSWGKRYRPIKARPTSSLDEECRYTS